MQTLIGLLWICFLYMGANSAELSNGPKWKANELRFKTVKEFRFRSPGSTDTQMYRGENHEVIYEISGSFFVLGSCQPETDLDAINLVLKGRSPSGELVTLSITPTAFTMADAGKEFPVYDGPRSLLGGSYAVKMATGASYTVRCGHCNHSNSSGAGRSHEHREQTSNKKISI